VKEFFIFVMAGSFNFFDGSVSFLKLLMRFLKLLLQLLYVGFSICALLHFLSLDTDGGLHLIVLFFRFLLWFS
jgi:hypothetical protein